MQRILQYIVAVIVGGITFLGLTLLQTVPVWWMLLLVIGISVPLYYGVFWYIKKIVEWDTNIYIASLATYISGIALITVIETVSVRGTVILFLSAMMALLYGWGVAQKQALFYSGKTFRRFMMMLFVFDTYAAATFLFAISSFFVTTSFFLFAVVIGATVYAITAVHIWRMYFAVDRQSLLIWGWIIGMGSLELMWVIHMLPFSYGVLGLLTTWLWYIMQLFVRFHLGERGILWKKQALFLSTNAILISAVLFFFVRWV